MKITLLCTAILLYSFYPVKKDDHKSITGSPQLQYDGYFKLEYYRIGFGSNMRKLQPMYIVNGDKFVYTMEEAWTRKGFESAKPDTILTGVIRASSIDSIVGIIAGMQDTTIYRVNPFILSGGEVVLDIFTDHNSVCFRLDNATDTTAKKIIAILNTYMPARRNKLRA